MLEPGGPPSSEISVQIISVMTSCGHKECGELIGDVKHGKGTYRYADGGEYVGGWVDDQRTGAGLMKYPNGDQYENQRPTTMS